MEERPRQQQYLVPNDGKKVNLIADECCRLLDEESVDEILLKVPLKHATRGVSLSEIIQRRCGNLAVENKVSHVFSGAMGVDRRKEALMLIRITRTSQPTIGRV